MQIQQMSVSEDIIHLSLKGKYICPAECDSNDNPALYLFIIQDEQRVSHFFI